MDARVKPGHDEWCAWMSTSFTLRPYRPEDEDAAIELWRLTWQQAYPAINFTARVPWWRERWRNELVPNAAIIVAEQADALVGFVTIDGTGYLDQLVVGPDHWGSPLATSLVDEAKRLSPDVRSACSSTRTIPGPSASMSATTLYMPART